MLVCWLAGGGGKQLLRELQQPLERGQEGGGGHEVPPARQRRARAQRPAPLPRARAPRARVQRRQRRLRQLPQQHATVQAMPTVVGNYLPTRV